MNVFRFAVIALFCIPADGQIKGYVVDVTDGAIPRATVRLLDEDSRVTVQRCQTDRSGRFQMEAISSGRYLIAASVPGFREKVIPYWPAKEFRIVLDLGGCDTPGTICDTFSQEPLSPDPRPIRSRGNLTIHLSEAVDLDKGSQNRSKADISLERVESRLYLKPINGAHLCEGADSMRVDGFGIGHDICVRTNAGGIAHLFLTAEVQPGSGSLTFHYVTRKK